MLLSGGPDSAAGLAFYIEAHRPTAALFVDYEQPSATQEAAAAHRVAEHYDVHLDIVRWTGSHSKSKGLIPARNAFLLSAALMERPSSVTVVAMGLHSGTDYADCSPNFLRHMQTIYDVYCNSRVQITAPFLDWTKAEVWAFAKSCNVPLAITHSCEAGTNEPCRECQSCRDRQLLVG